MLGTRVAHPADKRPARPRAKWPPESAAPRPRPEPATGAEPAQCAPAAPAAAARRRVSRAAGSAASPPVRQPAIASSLASSHSDSIIPTAPIASLFRCPVPSPSVPARSRQPGHPHRQLRIDHFKLAPCQLHLACGQRHILAVRPLRLDHLPGSSASRLRTRNSRTGTATSSSTGSRATGALSAIELAPLPAAEATDTSACSRGQLGRAGRRRLARLR